MMKRIGLWFCCAAMAASAAMAQDDAFTSRVIHIGMVVSDLEASMEFYKDIIGMTQVDRTEFEVAADFATRAGLTDGLPLSVKVLKLGRGDLATELKLMSFGDRAEKPEKPKHIHDRVGIRYITIYVRELNPILERLQANEIELLGETPIPLRGNDHFVLIQDPDGTFVELIGPLTQRRRFSVFD